MKRKSFSIKIDKPCSVNLSAMEKHDVGLYCTNCEKNVIDFSKLSDDEVIAIVEKLQGKFCGRMTKSQLNHVFISTQQRQRSPRLNKILAGLFALGMLESAQVEGKESVKDETVLTENNSTGNNAIAFQPTKISGDTTKNVFQGKLIDSDTKRPILSARIFLNGNLVTQSDTAGKFTVLIPDSLLSDSITIKITCDMFSDKTVKLTKNDLPATKTILLEENPMIDGGMMIQYDPPPSKNRRKNK